jgi:hypothetical protein
MTLHGLLVPGQKGRDRSPSIAVDFDDDGLIILCFETDQEHGFEMLNRIKESRPNVIVWLKMESKVGAEPAWNRWTEILVRCNSISSLLEESTEML